MPWPTHIDCCTRKGWIGPCARNFAQRRKTLSAGQPAAELRSAAARRTFWPGPGTKESSVSKLRAAVIGCGHLGRIHARLLSEFDDVQLVAVADPCQTAREQVADECGVPAISDYKTLLGSIEAAVVAAPTSQHEAIARTLIQAGVNILVEKPLTPSHMHANPWCSSRTDTTLCLPWDMWSDSYLHSWQPKNKLMNHSISKPLEPAVSLFAHSTSASCWT